MVNFAVENSEQKYRTKLEKLTIAFNSLKEDSDIEQFDIDELAKYLQDGINAAKNNHSY